MVMLGTAPHVRGPAFSREGVQRAGLPEELEGSVRGREPEVGRRAPRALEELDGCEPAAGCLDRVEDGSPLRRQARLRGKGQASIGLLLLRCARHCQGTLLKMILSINIRTIRFDRPGDA